MIRYKVTCSTRRNRPWLRDQYVLRLWSDRSFVHGSLLMRERPLCLCGGRELIPAMTRARLFLRVAAISPSPPSSRSLARAYLGFGCGRIVAAVSLLPPTIRLLSSMWSQRTSRKVWSMWNLPSAESHRIFLNMGYGCHLRTRIQGVSLWTRIQGVPYGLVFRVA
ncbi:hypothetical protein NEOLEDRAFT_118316 [Neolentinus lepideus HHB14362 ss-1]|uniref:Uncharacterized protein n=1 Tax=Neolentinus lepideus HHB14362 ss-1 TaxID=1314782 RepID=A0A165MTR4_9AGAM|nr:hypothetical protein NEOLEDRAFT_118316 [Neolentinus lepideus HHB14362 ss-1]